MYQHGCRVAFWNIDFTLSKAKTYTFKGDANINKYAIRHVWQEVNNRLFPRKE